MEKADVTIDPHVNIRRQRLLQHYRLSKLAPSRIVEPAMKVDPAIVKLLSLDPEKTSVSSAGGGSTFASTSKIVSQGDDGSEKAYFMKTGTGKESEIMFAGVC